MKIEESAFNILLDFSNGREPTLAFFYGIDKDGEFCPVAITGAGKQADEKNVSRYTVYCPDCVYYIAQSENLLGAVKMTVDGNKNVQMQVLLHNTGKVSQKTYISAYFHCLLSHVCFESFESKWYRSAQTTKDGFIIKTAEYLDRKTCVYYYGKIKRRYDGEAYSTTSRSDYTGGMSNQLASALPLRTGMFSACKPLTTFTEPSIAGDMLPLCLQTGESRTVAYTLAVAESETEASAKADKPVAPFGGESNIYGKIPAVHFEGDYGVDDQTLGYFVKNVLRQVEFCSRSKNYAGAYIGIRDIFQQLECALLWIPDYCKKKMLEALGYIGEDGRAPRQYSYSRIKGVPPGMDLRKYIDQGVWIISTFYRYICITGDVCVLDEKCGYYKLGDDRVDFSEQKDSVLAHLIRIAEYLISNLDEETNCLHILYGDWNDAVDGLGSAIDEKKEFGTGVSVMATMQLYQNLNELCEILRFVNGDKTLIKRYESVAQCILDGLQKYAIDENESGEKKVIHGWGDKYSYKIGSFFDNDGYSRDSATSNAFWVLSGVNDKADMTEHIVKAFARLESKYGIKTFEPYFALDNREVGRITNLPKGTAENGAVYIHATLFSIWALFEMGEYEKAWEQLVKILPPTHDFISTTPFVMPNSYVCNEEIGCDGESMSDWFTGSGCVLGKVLFFSVFGLRANIRGLEICPAVHKNTRKLQTMVRIKGGEISIIYQNGNGTQRTFFVNGESWESVYDGKLKAQKLVLSNEQIANKRLTITIFD